jgi:hypothetical protein
MRTPLAVLLLLAAASAQVAPTNVVSATVEGAVPIPDKQSIHVTLRNIGARPITAFSLAFTRIARDGQRIPCGGRGVDMIDWSDPMPGRNLYVSMRRTWITPNGTATFDGYPRCPDGQTPLENIQAELNLVMFDDGSGEGDPRQLEFNLRTRQQARNERAKWVGRFTALRTAPDLKSAAQSLYQDLVEATRAAEIDPGEAAKQGMAKPVRDELQRLALDIVQWAAHNPSLQKSDLLQWRLTDLEQRTERLVHGAGKTDVSAN